MTAEIYDGTTSCVKQEASKEREIQCSWLEFRADLVCLFFTFSNNSDKYIAFKSVPYALEMEFLTLSGNLALIFKSVRRDKGSYIERQNSNRIVVITVVGRGTGCLAKMSPTEMCCMTSLYLSSYMFILN